MRRAAVIVVILRPSIVTKKVSLLGLFAPQTLLLISLLEQPIFALRTACGLQHDQEREKVPSRAKMNKSEVPLYFIQLVLANIV